MNDPSAAERVRIAAIQSQMRHAPTAAAEFAKIFADLAAFFDLRAHAADALRVTAETKPTAFDERQRAALLQRL